MNENASPDDPLGPPLLGRVVPPVTGRNEALTGRHARKDGLGTLTTWPTIGLHPEDS
ncbi:hypothetical protein [Amycolatopsis kentuckyensis]|uniref:hypothetical protein n=1 Tax=Amycolatopsis kentuckyensis TaxID=218823 RepID=UPI003567FCA1